MIFAKLQSAKVSVAWEEILQASRFEHGENNTSLGFLAQYISPNPRIRDDAKVTWSLKCCRQNLVDEIRCCGSMDETVR